MILAFIDETLPLQFAPGANLSLTWIYGETLRRPFDVIDDVITIKKLFLLWFGTIFSYLMSNWSCVQYFEIFKMAAILSPTNFFYRALYRKLNIPERLPWAFPTFWAFDRCCNSNIDGDISLSKFDLLCDLVTSSMRSWIFIYIIVVIISWYICTGSLLMISLLVV